MGRRTCWNRRGCHAARTIAAEHSRIAATRIMRRRVIPGSIDHSTLAAARTTKATRNGLVQRSSSQARPPRHSRNAVPAPISPSHCRRLAALPEVGMSSVVSAE